MLNGGCLVNDIVQTRSKRSTRVALTTMISLSGGIMLSACGEGDAMPTANASQSVTSAADGETVDVYENVFECSRKSGKTREECGEMRKDAVDRAKVEAPRFAAIQDCEAEYGAGQCMESGKAESGHSRHFSPFIVAWFSSSRRTANIPLFKSGTSGFQTANGTRLGYAGAPGKYFSSNRAVERPKTVPKVKPASKLAKAGGFGPNAKSWHLRDRIGGGGRSARYSLGG